MGRKACAPARPGAHRTTCMLRAREGPPTAEVVALPTASKAKRTREAAGTAAGKDGRGAAAAAAARPAVFAPGPEFTPNMVAKAKRIIDKGLFARVESGVCQVASSDGSSYLASCSPNSCQCMSFKVRRVCSHVLVVQMVDAASGGSGSGSGAGPDGPRGGGGK